MQYRAASGYTDGRFGSFDTQVDAVFLYGNGTINYEASYIFGYQAQHELSIVRKALARSLYSSDYKLYSCYHGCLEGNRGEWSQVQ